MQEARDAFITPELISGPLVRNSQGPKKVRSVFENGIYAFNPAQDDNEMGRPRAEVLYYFNFCPLAFDCNYLRPSFIGIFHWRC